MLVKAEYELLSPVMAEEAFPMLADGAIAWHSFVLKNKKAPTPSEVLTESADMPFVKTQTDGGFFYNIGSFIFDEKISLSTSITRKPPMPRDLNLRKILKLGPSAKYGEIEGGKGAFKGVRVKGLNLLSSKTDSVYFYAEIDDKRQDEATDILYALQSIGKRTVGGNGWIKAHSVSLVSEEERADGFFIEKDGKKFLYRPIPAYMLKDDEYDYSYQGSLLPPHFKNIFNKKETTYAFRRNVHEI